MFEIILSSASSAFIDVTSFVGAVLIFFGYLNYKKDGRLLDLIREKKAWQPFIGAILGLTPGCGGAILVMPMFVKKHVSFGTVVATLIATAGDSAFVLIAQDLKSFAVVTILTFLVAVASGYFVDFFAIGTKLNRKNKSLLLNCKCKGRQKRIDSIKHLGHEHGDDIEKLLHCKSKGHQKENSFGYFITHKLYFIYWGLLAVGLVFGILGLLQVAVDGDFVLWVGMIGTASSILLMIAGKKYFSDDTHEEEELKRMSLKETVIHGAEETAFVGTWVFVAYLAYSYSILLIGTEVVESWIISFGIFTVILGAVLGMIPGCGIQIIFVSLYVQGLIPFAALLSHTISQDGDALFPLIALNKKAAIWATVITTLIALVVGLGAFYFS